MRRTVAPRTRASPLGPPRSGRSQRRLGRRSRGGRFPSSRSRRPAPPATPRDCEQESSPERRDAGTLLGREFPARLGDAAPHQQALEHGHPHEAPDDFAECCCFLGKRRRVWTLRHQRTEESDGQRRENRAEEPPATIEDAERPPLTVFASRFALITAAQSSKIVARPQNPRSSFRLANDGVDA